MQKDVCVLEPVYTTGFGFLGTAKPTLPELTPETKGIAEGDRSFSCA
jgi:hypothetical protein